MISDPDHRASRNRWLLNLLVAMLATKMVSLVTGFAPFGWIGNAGFVILCVAGARILTLREHVLLLMAVGLSGAAYWQMGFAPVSDALELATFFGLFIAALTAMRDVAARSRSVLAVGQFLTRQPPGRRFVATALGGHFLGVFLNFGAVSLMSPLIQQSCVTPDGQKDTALEQRQLSALIRGFAWVILWAPTMLAQAVLQTLFPDVSWRDFGPLGLCTAVIFIMLGRAFDRVEWRNLPLAVGRVATQPTLPVTALITLVVICAVLIGSTLTASVLTGASVAVALLWVAPIATVLWFTCQPKTQDSLPQILSRSAASLTRSAVALGLSGMIGRLAGDLFHAQDMVVPGLSTMPGWLFLALLPVVITLGGQVALSPIMIVVFLGELFQATPDLPTGHWQIVFALSMGWALSMTASPNATATLLISATTNIPPTTLTWRWNLKYGVACYCVAVAIFAFIA